MRSIALPRLVAFVAAASLLAACGGGAAEPSVDARTTSVPESTVSVTEAAHTGADGSEVCALLTDDDVTQLLGVPATSVEQTVTGPLIAYQWVNDATLPIQLLQVGTFDFDVDSEFFRETAGSFASDLEEVPGLGDEALWTGDQLFIRQRQLMISIVPSRNGGRDQAVAAAQLAIPRLE